MNGEQNGCTVHCHAENLLSRLSLVDINSAWILTVHLVLN